MKRNPEVQGNQRPAEKRLEEVREKSPSADAQRERLKNNRDGNKSSSSNETSEDVTDKHHDS